MTQFTEGEYITRGGFEAEVFRHTRDDDKLYGRIQNEIGDWLACSWYSDGGCVLGEDNPCDLVEVRCLICGDCHKNESIPFACQTGDGL